MARSLRKGAISFGLVHIPVELFSAGIAERELQMALSRMDDMSDAWQPEQYRDTYRDDILAWPSGKSRPARPKSITQPGAGKPEAAAGNVIEPMALLQQSLGKQPAPPMTTTRAARRRNRKAGRLAARRKSG